MSGEKGLFMQIAVENSQELLLKRQEFGSTKPFILQVSCMPLFAASSHRLFFSPLN